MSRLFFIPQAVRINSVGTPYAAAKANFYLTTTTTRTDTYTDNARGTPHDNPVVADAAGQFAAIYLDPAITYRCIITESDDTLIDDIDPVHAPLAGADIAITDSGGYFAGTEVEAILQDIGNKYLKTDRADTISVVITFSGGTAKIAMADNIIERPKLKDYGITHTAPSSSSGTLVLDLTTGNSFVTTLTENITTLTISNPPASGTYGQFTLRVIQDGASGAYTLAWPASVKFPGGTDPVITTSNDAVDIITCYTIDGGTTWYGDFSQAYA